MSLKKAKEISQSNSFKIMYRITMIAVAILERRMRKRRK